MSTRSFTAVRGAFRLETTLLARSPFDVVFLALVPLQALGFLAVVRFAGRGDLDVIAIVAPGLIALWQNALFTCGEIISKDRDNQRLELLAASPSSFFSYLVGRVAAVTAFSLVVVAEAVLVGWVLFGVDIASSGIPIAAGTIAVAAVATVATSILLSTVFVNTRNPHTYQNALGYPFFILGGVLVPTSVFPHWLERVSDFVYLSWTADLLRDAFTTGSADGWLAGNAAVLGLAISTAAVSAFMLRRTLRTARQEGRLALS